MRAMSFSRPSGPATVPGENFQLRMMPLPIRAWSIFATLEATAVGPLTSWLAARVWTGPMQSLTGS